MRHKLVENGSTQRLQGNTYVRIVVEDALSPVYYRSTSGLTRARDPTPAYHVASPSRPRATCVRKPRLLAHQANVKTAFLADTVDFYH